MSKQPFSANFRNNRLGAQILDCHRRFSRPTCKQNLFFGRNGMFGATMNRGNDFLCALLQGGHPALVARSTNSFDLQVKTLGISTSNFGWLTLNERFPIYEHTLPRWGREQRRKTRTKDMLFSHRLPTAKDAYPRHELGNYPFSLQGGDNDLM